MKAYFSEIIPKLEIYSKKLNEVALLTNKDWLLIDEDSIDKTVFIFRSNNELIISTNGTVVKGNWENIGNNSILIEYENHSLLFKHGFIDKKILALKKNSFENQFVIFVNENEFNLSNISYNTVINTLMNDYEEGREEKRREEKRREEKRRKKKKKNNIQKFWLLIKQKLEKFKLNKTLKIQDLKLEIKSLWMENLLKMVNINWDYCGI